MPIKLTEQERLEAYKQLVIRGLKQCLMDDSNEAYDTQCFDCPYYDPDVAFPACKCDLLADAISLLES